MNNKRILELCGVHNNRINEILNEAGQESGKYELAKTPVDGAIKLSSMKGHDAEAEINNFKRNYEKAYSLVKSYGKTQRKDMPVIDEKDVKSLQSRLKVGSIDVNKPFAKDTNPSDPFPKGVGGKHADEWLRNGLRDGDKNDDRIGVSKKKISVGDLKPIQKQIYLDKSLLFLFKFGVDKALSFITNGPTTFIVSADNRIIDGHHRWAQGVMLDPSAKVSCLVIDLPIAKLLPMSLTYSDAVGNKRNQ
jgi:hypothetical protein